MRKSAKRKLVLPLAVYLVQIPILVSYVLGLVPIHPIATVLPLVIFLNVQVDRRGPEGLGLTVVWSGRSFLLVFVFAALGFAGRFIALRSKAIPLHLPPLTIPTVASFGKALAVDIFIIAMWEEIVNRGYTQTRLQAAWGFRGVLVTTLLFASLHIPSAFDSYGLKPAVLCRFIQTGLEGFLLGCVYWWTGSVVATTALHGLRNFGLSVILRLSNLTAARAHVISMPVQLAWLVVEVGLVLLGCWFLFGQQECLRAGPAGRSQPT